MEILSALRSEDERRMNMARYIDADKLIRHLKDEHEKCTPPNDDRQGEVAYGAMLGLKMAISYAETLSTADVVPRAEYEALQIELDAMRGAANSYKMHYEEAKAQVEEWKAIANDLQNQILKLIEEMEIYQEHIDYDITYAKDIKAEAIKELLERAEDRVTYFEDECGAFVPFVDCRDLDAIAEELSEEGAE